MEYYLAIKKNEVLIYATWMNIEKLCLMKEASHKRPFTSSLYEMPRIGKSIETKNISSSLGVEVENGEGIE